MRAGPPVAWPEPEPAPIFGSSRPGTAALAVGERAAARLTPLETGEIEARIIRRLEPRRRARRRRLPARPRRRPGRAGRPPQPQRVPGRRAATPAAPPTASWSSPRQLPRAGSARRGRASSSGWDPLGPRRDQPAGDRRVRHPDRVSRRGAGRSRGGAAGDARPGAPICATSRWSRSTAAMRAISTTRCGPSRIPTRRTAAAGTSSSRSPMSPGMCGPAARSTARPSGAAIRSISPTASCRCCPRRCRTSCAR